MKNTLRRRFWFEACMSITASVLLAITLLWRNWIEVLLHIDPDQGNGSLEWAIVGTLFFVTLISLAMSIYEWRRFRIRLA